MESLVSIWRSWSWIERFYSWYCWFRSYW